MKKLFVFVVLSVSVLLLTAQDTEPIHIIPNPSSVIVGNGHLSLKPQITISVDGEGVQHIIDQFKDRLLKATDTRATIVQNGADIAFQLSKNEDSALGSEGYRLIVTATNVMILANKPAGLFYGMQSFFQLLPKRSEANNAIRIKQIRDWKIPVVTITDTPRFGWR